MSPILVRPVREQLEHDRLIRFLLPRYEKKFDVLANAGDAQTAPVKLSSPAPFFPDLVLLSGSKIAGLVEVETGESTNNLEALAQWQHFARARVPFHLYVPVLMLDAALRFCAAYKVGVTEIWTYRPLFDGFDLVRAVHDPSAVAKTPRAASVVAKLLPPVTPEKVEPEKDARLAELSNLVELANRTFKAAAGKSLAASVAAKAAAAAARAAAKATKAAAKAAAKVGVDKAPEATPTAPPPKTAKVTAPSAAVRKVAPKPKAKKLARSAKAPKLKTPVKVVAKRARPTKVVTKTHKARKPAARPTKPAKKSVTRAAKQTKPARSKSKSKKSAVATKPKKAARKR